MPLKKLVISTKYLAQRNWLFLTQFKGIYNKCICKHFCILQNTDILQAKNNFLLYRRVSSAEESLLVTPGKHSVKGTYQLDTMGKSDGLPLEKVISDLNSFAPQSLAELWDNVGLLVEPVTPTTVSKILLTNDLTEDVMQEALELSTNLIISYHPPIFAPLKSVTTRSWKERLVATCLENKIALYSPHTCYDALKGGVNDWLASAFETVLVTPLVQSYSSVKVDHLVEVSFPDSQLGNSLLQEFESAITKLGESQKLSSNVIKGPNGDNALSVQCCKSTLPKLAEVFYGSSFASESGRFKVSTYDKNPIPGYGMGRLCKLKGSLTVQAVVDLVKKHIGVDHLQLALARGKNHGAAVSTIALCAGSGASVLRGVTADLYLTGEMDHHSVLDAAQRGTHVVLCHHSNSERGFLHSLAGTLAELLGGKVEVVVSQKDHDPLRIV